MYNVIYRRTGVICRGYIKTSVTFCGRWTTLFWNIAKYVPGPPA